jgi:hypothetical protein
MISAIYSMKERIHRQIQVKRIAVGVSVVEVRGWGITTILIHSADRYR